MEPRRMRPDDVEPCAWAIARAFAWHEPWGEWALPDPAIRERTLVGLIAADLNDRFIPHGESWTIDRRSVALWIPPAGHRGSEAFRSRRREGDFALYGNRAAAMRAGDELIASMRPEVEHWYLDTLATDPDHFGEGLAAALLDHSLAIRDAEGSVCALDTHTPEQVALYERRGFEVTGEGRLPDGPAVVMMVREPRRPADP